MIPKIIHYCWFGNSPLPESAVMCIDSWRRYMPDYEIRRWDESNFDIAIIPYTKEAYEEGKYAFVSDFARFWILYNYGGIYFDTDVEMIRPIYDIVDSGSFMGCERDSFRLNATMPGVAPGLGMGAHKGHKLLLEFLEMYNDLHFVTNGVHNLKTVDQYTTELLAKYDLKLTDKVQLVAETNIYPGEYFGPISVITKRLHITDNTRTIHHYAATWQSKSLMSTIKKRLREVLPERLLLYINRIKNNW